MNRSTFLRASLIAIVTACAEGPTLPGGDPVAARKRPALTQRADPLMFFLQPAADAPPLAQTSVSFWAVRGKDRRATIWYRKREGALDSTALARIRVRKESLVRRPDGSLIAVGDSILITMSVPDPARQVVEFQPSGLKFNPNEPANLNLWYLEADHDFNDDGATDGADAAIEQQFQVWRQELPGQPWVSQTSLLSVLNDQLETDIDGFTRYAVSY